MCKCNYKELLLPVSLMPLSNATLNYKNHAAISLQVQKLVNLRENNIAAYSWLEHVANWLVKSYCYQKQSVLLIHDHQPAGKIFLLFLPCF